MDALAPSSLVQAAQFVAVNTIHCDASYVSRFEELFSTRARAIDRVPGFLAMHVLKPSSPQGPYLVVSYWERGECFDNWVGSPEFHEGHKRAFEDLRKAKEEGRESPMRSDFATYSVMAT